MRYVLSHRHMANPVLQQLLAMIQNNFKVAWKKPTQLLWKVTNIKYKYGILDKINTYKYKLTRPQAA